MLIREKEGIDNEMSVEPLYMVVYKTICTNVRIFQHP